MARGGAGDVVRNDLQSLHLFPSWYSLASDRSRWVESISEALNGRADAALSKPLPRPHMCTTCHRAFRRRGDLVRHKCTEERSKPLCQQAGAVQCPSCQGWFASCGGLAVHTCTGSSQTQSHNDRPATTQHRRAVTDAPCCQRHCSTCNRCFKSKSGFSRHNCNRGKRIQDWSEFNITCPTCLRTFRRPQDLKRHKCTS